MRSAWRSSARSCPEVFGRRGGNRRSASARAPGDCRELDRRRGECGRAATAAGRRGADQASELAFVSGMGSAGAGRRRVRRGWLTDRHGMAALEVTAGPTDHRGRRCIQEAVREPLRDAGVTLRLPRGRGIGPRGARLAARTSASAAGTAMAALGAVHLAWAAGSSWPVRDRKTLAVSASGREEGDPPSAHACLGVSGITPGGLCTDDGAATWPTTNPSPRVAASLASPSSLADVSACLAVRICSFLERDQIASGRSIAASTAPSASASACCPFPRVFLEELVVTN